MLGKHALNSASSSSFVILPVETSKSLGGSRLTKNELMKSESFVTKTRPSRLAARFKVLVFLRLAARKSAGSGRKSGCRGTGPGFQFGLRWRAVARRLLPREALSQSECVQLTTTPHPDPRSLVLELPELSPVSKACHLRLSITCRSFCASFTSSHQKECCGRAAKGPSLTTGVRGGPAS